MPDDETKSISLGTVVNYFMANGPAWFLLAAVLYAINSGLPFIFERIDKIQADQAGVVKDLTSELKTTNKVLGDTSDSIKKSNDRIESTMSKIEVAVDKLKGIMP